MRRIYQVIAQGALSGACLLPFSALGQEVIATSGASYQNGTAGITFTIGEPVTETRAASGLSVTQGFNQPPSDFSTEVISMSDASISIGAFPNPAREHVNITASGIEGPLELKMFDASARLIATHTFVPTQHAIDVSSLSNGSYSIVALSEDRIIATIKLTINR